MMNCLIVSCETIPWAKSRCLYSSEHDSISFSSDFNIASLSLNILTYGFWADFVDSMLDSILDMLDSRAFNSIDACLNSASRASSFVLTSFDLDSKLAIFSCWFLDIDKIDSFFEENSLALMSICLISSMYLLKL